MTTSDCLVHIWIDGEFDRTTEGYRDFCKSYTLKIQQNQCHHDFANKPLIQTYT